MKTFRLLIFLLALTLFYKPLFSQSTGKITGKVTDVKTGDPLPGANVLIKGTVIGAATDIKGRYLIVGVPAGPHKMVVSYIGYEIKEVPVDVKASEVVRKDVALRFTTLKGKAVVVTAQAKGNFQAINQQISAPTIKNIVSSAKIQELPESNAAEAVGRLPGVSLQREGGEGNKVVIRGLSPQYSKVQMEGVTMAATGGEDRSTDLSMISPYMLAGIEVQKTATADQEADQLGGTVNFRIREASEEPSLSAMVQRGYNGLREEFKDYKFVLAGSKRFFDKKLGVFTNLDLERKNRSDHSVFADYEMQDYNDISYAIANSVVFQDIGRINRRLGGTLVLDYQLPTTKLKLFTTYNSINTEFETLQELLSVGGSGDRSREHRYIANYYETDLTTMTNALKLEQYIGNIKVSAGVSYSSSRREVPVDLQLDGVEESGFRFPSGYEDPIVLGDLKGFLVDSTRGYLHPTEFTKKANNDTTETFVDWIYDRESETFEEEVAADLNFEFETSLMDFVNLKLKFGGKYKHKNKDYDYEGYEHACWWTTFDPPEAWYNKLKDSPYLDGWVYGAETHFPYSPFIDTDYDVGKFMAGDYKINRIPNMDMIIEYIQMIERTDKGNPWGLTKNYNISIPNDYYGHEDYAAAYIMPTLQIGKSFTLIPGVRYEHNETAYTANRTAAMGRWCDPFAYDDTTTTRNNDFFLPMIHAKYNVTDWFDIRASYTQTISRPSYNLIIPTWQIIPEKSLSWNNTYLDPIESKNSDIFFSFYGQKIGLITIGAFHKTISNFIYNTTTYITDESMILDAYPPQVKKGGQVYGFINNPNDATLYGSELEWQSNLWFLPGLLRGIVLNVNYTYTFSELEYPLVTAKYDSALLELGFKKIVGSIDASYTDRLIDQPTHLLNLIIGYDIKGFSIRWPMRYKSHVFMADHYYPELRQSTEPLILYDLAIKQELPIKGLRLFCNTSNLSRAVGTNANQGTGWFTDREYYGMTGEVGLRYDF